MGSAIALTTMVSELAVDRLGGRHVSLICLGNHSVSLFVWSILSR